MSVDTSPIMITDTATLQQYCENWQNCRALAIDTEFIRVQTYYPIPALIQVFDGKDCFLIDPKPIRDFSPLAAIFSNPDIIKILHSCSEDLEVFDQVPGCLPSPLFDTQIAASMAGMGFSMGYSRLVKACFDVDLPKEETRSDWLQRPLSHQQIEYACLDVVYLHQLFERLETQLANTSKHDWVIQECKAIVDNFEQSRDPALAVTRLKNAWRLPAEDQALLARLAVWREKKAREEDRPRNHVLKENSLYSLARNRPQCIEDLPEIDDLSHRQRKRYGSELVAIIQDSDESAGDEQLLFPPPLPKTFNKLVSELKACAASVAEENKTAPETLLRKKDIEALVRSYIENGTFNLPESLCGWKKSVIGDKLLELCQRSFS